MPELSADEAFVMSLVLDIVGSHQPRTRLGGIVFMDIVEALSLEYGSGVPAARRLERVLAVACRRGLLIKIGEGYRAGVSGCRKSLRQSKPQAVGPSPLTLVAPVQSPGDAAARAQPCVHRAPTITCLPRELIVYILKLSSPSASSECPCTPARVLQRAASVRGLACGATRTRSPSLATRSPLARL